MLKRLHVLYKIFNVMHPFADGAISRDSVMKRTVPTLAPLLILMFLMLSCGNDTKSPADSGKTEPPLPLEFVAVPGGSCQMGGEPGTLGSGCCTAHGATVSGFEMSVYEITNAQYAQYLNEALASGDIDVKYGSVYGKTGQWIGYRYLEFGRQAVTENSCWITFDNGVFSVTAGKENWPVVLVTWHGSKSFAMHYRLDLPTEAEWEYACRGGKQLMYGTDDGTIGAGKANYIDTGVKHPMAVGSYPSNPFGIYDMAGNVCEWCHDWYEAYTGENAINPSGPQKGSLRILRGGHYDTYDTFCTSAVRNSVPPDTRDVVTGFRVVRRLSPQNY